MSVQLFGVIYVAAMKAERYERDFFSLVFVYVFYKKIELSEKII